MNATQMADTTCGLIPAVVLGLIVEISTLIYGTSTCKAFSHHIESLAYTPSLIFLQTEKLSWVGHNAFDSWTV